MVEGVLPASGAQVSMLGVEENLEWERQDQGFSLTIPKTVQNNPPCIDAWVFRISEIERN